MQVLSCAVADLNEIEIPPLHKTGGLHIHHSEVNAPETVTEEGSPMDSILKVLTYLRQNPAQEANQEPSGMLDAGESATSTSMVVKMSSEHDTREFRPVETLPKHWRFRSIEPGCTQISDLPRARTTPISNNHYSPLKEEVSNDDEDKEDVAMKGIKRHGNHRAWAQGRGKEKKMHPNLCYPLRNQKKSATADESTAYSLSPTPERLTIRILGKKPRMTGPASPPSITNVNTNPALPEMDKALHDSTHGSI